MIFVVFNLTLSPIPSRLSAMRQLCEQYIARGEHLSHQISSILCGAIGSAFGCYTTPSSCNRKVSGSIPGGGELLLLPFPQILIVLAGSPEKA